MDKLQPIIRNRFWILAGLVLPLAIYGYFAANGALKAATATRAGELKSKLDGVSSGNVPNKDYQEKLAHINDFFEKSVDEVIVDLWKHQQERMTWPPIIAHRIPKAFMGDIEPTVLVTYKGVYPRLIMDLEEFVEPVMPVTGRDQTRTGRARELNRLLPNMQLQTNVQWKGKVILEATLPQALFGNIGITSEEMWNAQIDNWLVKLLLEAVKNTNQDKDSVTEAVIRRIDRVQLMGGDGNPSAGGGAEGEFGDEFGGDMGMDMEGMGGAIGALTLAPIVSSVAFDPAQEFGPAMDMAGGEMSMDFDPMAMAAGGAGPKRYIGDPEAEPYWERGFYLSVIIMQNKIPDFLVELANSDWPIRVTRFHVGANPYRTELPPGMTNIAGAPSSGMGGLRSGLGGGLLGGGGGGRLGSMLSAMGGGMGDFGGAMGGMAGMAGAGGNPLAQGLPPFALAALNHPDLVQLDMCGVITIYKQPTEILEALEAQKAAGAAVEGAPVDPEGPTDATPLPESGEGAAPLNLNLNPDSPPVTTDPDVDAPATEADVEAPATESDAESESVENP